MPEDFLPYDQTNAQTIDADRLTWLARHPEGMQAIASAYTGRQQYRTARLRAVIDWEIRRDVQRQIERILATQALAHARERSGRRGLPDLTQTARKTETPYQRFHVQQRDSRRLDWLGQHPDALQALAMAYSAAPQRSGAAVQLRTMIDRAIRRPYARTAPSK
jgi:hypothetical protein